MTSEFEGTQHSRTGQQEDVASGHHDSSPEEDGRLLWISFYEDIATKLLSFRYRRRELVSQINELAARVEGLSPFNDQPVKGSFAPLTDICPFTVLGTMNRWVNEANRKIIAGELATILGVTQPVPSSFDGIPLLHNQKTWFFASQYERQPDDIDTLWEVFAQAISFADGNESAREAFVSAYNSALLQRNVKWNLTMGLYWSRPFQFPTLDAASRKYLMNTLGFRIGVSGPKKCCSAEDYLVLRDDLLPHFKAQQSLVQSFPHLSLAAWLSDKEDKKSSARAAAADADDRDMSDAFEPYSVDDILNDGCFIDREKLETILRRFRAKKNLVLQGPPGTGKTWLARRMAYALVGERNDNRVKAVQFHPNMSYEDFIRGWRPSGDGKLTLVDGPFMEAIGAASSDQQSDYVVVIEEINRGIPAQIFGEMLTLLEADKRHPSEALELSYQGDNDQPVYLPPNLHVIGTMNVADRSLALVDLALRRRFAFVSLQPTLGKPWRDWVHETAGIDTDVLRDIEKRVLALNHVIANDKSLGSQFQVGHSYVTPGIGQAIGDAHEWFRQVVEMEIGPLLEEYWFDDREKAQEQQKHLLKDL